MLEGTHDYAAKVALNEGTNLIEIIASDYEGNQLAFYLIVIYEKGHIGGS